MISWQHNKFVNYTPDLPDSIRCKFLYNSVKVEFEHTLVNGYWNKNENYDQLWVWCNTHCSSLFTCIKQDNMTSLFMFDSTDDMKKFTNHLQTIGGNQHGTRNQQGHHTTHA
jgi:hypothetical protein